MTGAIQDPRQRLDALAGLPAGDRLRALSDWGPPEAVLLSLIEEAGAVAAVNSRRGDDLTEILAAVADEARSPLAQTRARRARVHALAYASRYDQALDVCGDAIGIAEGAGLDEEAGRIRLASMHPLIELGRLGEAIEAADAAKATFRQLGAPDLAARAEINLGVAYQRSGRIDGALACFDRARPALRDEPLMRGHLDNNRGEALVCLNDFTAAEAAFTAAREAFEQAGADLPAAIAEGNLADLAIRRGELARGLELFERARRRLEVAGSPSHLARLHAEQAEAKALLGMNVQALQAYEQALAELDRCHLPLEAARARAGMGQLLLRLERRAEAETALAAAATGFDELGNRSARARVDLIRAELLAANGRGTAARAMALRSLALLEDRPAEACAARHLVARIAADEGDLDLAEQELGAAIRVAQRLDLAPALADLWHTHGVVARRRGRNGAALRRFWRAVEQVERIRGTLQAERFRAAFLGQRSSLFEDLVGTLLGSPRRRDIVEHAFAAVERCKSRALLDRLQGATDRDWRDDAAPTANPPERALHQRLGALRSELNALYSRLGDDRSVTRGDRAMTAWREAIHEKERELDEVESRLASVRGPADLRAPVVALTSLQEMMDGRTLLIEYFAVGDELIAFLIGRERALVRRDLARVGEVDELLRRLHFQIDRAMRPAAVDGRRGPRLIADVQRELSALFDALVRPLADRMNGADRLVFAPHGPLHAVPFNALFDGRSYLIEQHEITVVPSASLYAHLRVSAAERAAERATALVVGVADDVAARIADEADLVAALLGDLDVRRLSGPDATMGRVLQHAPDHAVIHLACHGRFDPEHPLASGLRLADRWLTTQDVCLMRLRADLVTLSACESGLNVVTAGDELIGLFRALLAAGARSVLASLWRVDDESALAAMQSFYDAWRDGRSSSAASALRRAQLRLMEHRPHPAHWAPFTLIGAAS